MPNLTLAGLLATICLFCSGPGLSQSFGPLVLNPFPDSVKTARSWLWLPPSSDSGRPLRGLLVLPDYEAGRAIWADSTLGWHRFCREQGLGMLLHDFTNRVGEKKLLRSALGPALLKAHLARWVDSTGQADLAQLGWVLIGLSQGGMQAFAFAREQPKQVIAVVQIHPSTASVQFETREQWSDPRVHGVPMLYVIGGQDNIGGVLGEAYACSRRLLNLFLAPARAFDPPWTAYIERTVSHAALGDPEFPQQWLATVMAQRLPATKPFWPLRPIAIQLGWAGAIHWGWYGSRNQYQETKRLEAMPYPLAAVEEDTVPPEYLHLTWLPARELVTPWAQVQNAATALAAEPPPVAVVAHLWPNPQRVGQTVELNAPGLLAWELLTLNGQSMLGGQGGDSGHVTLETKELPAGTYWLRLKTARGIAWQRLVLISSR